MRNPAADARRRRVIMAILSGTTVIATAKSESISTQRVYQILSESRVATPRGAQRHPGVESESSEDADSEVRVTDPDVSQVGGWWWQQRFAKSSEVEP